MEQIESNLMELFDSDEKYETLKGHADNEMETLFGRFNNLIEVDQNLFMELSGRLYVEKGKGYLHKNGRSIGNLSTLLDFHNNYKRCLVYLTEHIGDTIITLNQDYRQLKAHKAKDYGVLSGLLILHNKRNLCSDVVSVIHSYLY